MYRIQIIENTDPNISVEDLDKWLTENTHSDPNSFMGISIPDMIELSKAYPDVVMRMLICDDISEEVDAAYYFHNGGRYEAEVRRIIDEFDKDKLVK